LWINSYLNHPPSTGTTQSGEKEDVMEDLERILIKYTWQVVSAGTGFGFFVAWIVQGVRRKRLLEKLLSGNQYQYPMGLTLDQDEQILCSGILFCNLSPALIDTHLTLVPEKDPRTRVRGVTLWFKKTANYQIEGGKIKY